jgi:hypothetical protein
VPPFSGLTHVSASAVLTCGITQTSINHARMYDPVLGRFVSADSIVPGAASGAGGGAATLGVDGSSQLAPLTVDFHEPGFVAMLNSENAFKQQKDFFFQLSDDDRRAMKSPWGPANPQARKRQEHFYLLVFTGSLRNEQHHVPTNDTDSHVHQFRTLTICKLQN